MVRSVIVEKAGGPEVLALGERPALEPGPHQLLVETRAVGVNFIEIYQREGVYPVEHPFTPGSEGMGVVIGVGAAVDNYAVGDRITTTQAERTYADAFLVKADEALRVPDGIPDEVAAAIPGQGLTAHYLVRSTYPVQKGEIAVITAGAGGVGGLVVQLLKAAGATVIAIVGSAGKAEAAGSVPPFDLQQLNKHGSLYVTRPTVDDYLQDEEERSWRAGELFEAVLNGSLEVRVAGTFPLEQAHRAHTVLQSRAANGKLLLIP